VFFAVVDRAVALVWLMGGGGGFVLYTTLFAAVRLGFVHVDHASLDALAVAGSAAWRRSEEALRRMNDTLEAETRRIAHEIHNEAGQLLTVAQLTLADVAREMTPAAQESLQEVSCVLDEIAEELRRLAHEMRPIILDNLGLVPALEVLAEGVTKRTALTIRVEGAEDERLPSIIETALYRIVQEAITNVVKHARAQGVVIRVDREPRSVRCSIRDDGVGFDAKAVSRHTERSGLGLPGIANRAEALGGTLEIIAAPGQGTALLINIPVTANT
jgi:signal transduction histidine kinase